jgi:hypothetical protein
MGCAAVGSVAGSMRNGSGLWKLRTKNSFTVRENAHSATTLRSGRSFRHSGPVLAYVPDYEMMDLATEVASDASLAVVETIEYPLMGWAMEVRAIDLVTGEDTPDTRTDSQRRELDRVLFSAPTSPATATCWAFGWAPAVRAPTLDGLSVRATQRRRVRCVHRGL